MKIIVNSRCFVKGTPLETQNGKPQEVADFIAKAAITCGRAVKATAKSAAKKEESGEK